MHREAPLTQVPEVADPGHLTAAEVQALVGRIARVAEQQLFFMFLPFGTQLEVLVTLADSVGRAVSEVGAIP